MYRILIVDDEELIRDGLKKIIDWDEHGIEIAGEASNGVEALEAVKKIKPDLLITDIKMPVMDGLSLIKAIRDANLNTKIVIISGYDDFQFVKESLKYGVENYIIKPINKEELSATLVSAVEKIQSETYDRIKSRQNEFVIRDSILYRLVTNRISKRELEEKSSLLDIGSQDTYFLVTIIKALKPENNGADIAIKDSSLFGAAMVNILQETIGKVLNCKIFIDLNGDAVVIFHSSTMSSIADNIDALMKECINNIKQYLNSDVFIVIGNVQEEIDAVHLSYKAAADLLQYFVVFPRNHILSSEKPEWKNKGEYDCCTIDQDILQNIIMAGRNEDIINYFTQLHENLSRAEGLSMEYVNTFTVELLTCLINTIKASFAETEEVLKSYEELFSSFLKQKQPETLITAARKVALELAGMIRQNREKPKPLADQIIDYINNNYHKVDLSLKSLSHQFNFTTPYLGQLLKKKTGELFSEYLNRVRLENARELLLKTNLKANEIAERVGYADPNYFYRVFKKITGEYPSEYRDTN